MKSLREDLYSNNQNIVQNTKNQWNKNEGMQNTVLSSDNSTIFAELQTDNEDRANSSNLENAFMEAKQKQGFLGNIWNGFKNLTGLGLSSNDVEDKIKQYENGEITYDEALSSIESFETKQNSIVDLAANVSSGIVTGAITIGGTLISAGLGTGGAIAAGAALGGTVKAGIKAADRATNGVEGDAADFKQIAKDTFTGAVDGALNVATAGMFDGVAKAGQTVKQAVINGVKAGAVSGAVSGAAAGAASYTAEAVLEDDVEFEVSGLVSSTIQNATTGAVMGGVMGGITGGIKQNSMNKTKAATNADNTSIENNNNNDDANISDNKQKIEDEVQKTESGEQKTGDSNPVEQKDTVCELEKTPLISNEDAIKAELFNGIEEGTPLHDTIEQNYNKLIEAGYNPSSDTITLARESAPEWLDTYALSIKDRVSYDGFDIDSYASNLAKLNTFINKYGCDEQATAFSRAIFNKHGEIDPLVLDDFYRYADTLENGGSIKDAFVPKYSSIEDALDDVDIGDTVRVADTESGVEKLWIKRANGSMAELDMTPDEYLELFPPVTRYTNLQGEVGDCWLVSGLDSIYKDKETRYAILRSFQRADDGSLTVTVGNTTRTLDSLDFANYTDDVSREGTYNLHGSKGMQALENAFGIDKISKKACKLTNKAASSDPDIAAEAAKELSKLNKLVSEGKELDAGVIAREGGTELEAVFKLSSSDVSKEGLRGKIDNTSQVDKYLLSSDEEFQKALHYISSSTEDGSDTCAIAKELGLYHNHAYSLNRTKDASGSYVFELTNPHNAAKKLSFTLEQIREYFKGGIFDVVLKEGLA